jgi:hypothetical protein
MKSFINSHSKSSTGLLVLIHPPMGTSFEKGRRNIVELLQKNKDRFQTCPY